MLPVRPALQGNKGEYLDAQRPVHVRVGHPKDLMNRRTFLASIPAFFIPAWAVNPPEDPTTVWNEFAAASRDYLEIMNHKAASGVTISLAEIHAWVKVKQTWRKVERVFGEMYRV